MSILTWCLQHYWILFITGCVWFIFWAGAAALYVGGDSAHMFDLWGWRLLWFFLGGILGPFGPVFRYLAGLASPRIVGMAVSCDLDYGRSLTAGWEFLCSILNPVSLFSEWERTQKYRRLHNRRTGIFWRIVETCRGLSGSNIEELAATGDIVRLWGKLKNRDGDYGIFLRFPDQAWDAAMTWWLQHPGERLALMMFSKFLVDNGKPYAGSLAVTPVEWWSRLSRDFGGEPNRDALCPVCGKYLSESPIEGEEGMYRVCKTCGRYYHRECAAGTPPCKLCNHREWKWDLRK